MIISHKYKFIFIKTSKTAGTSIEIALSKFCGENDIITRNSPAEEKLRRRLGCRGPQNYLIPFSEYTPGDWIRCLQKKKRLHIRAHISAKDIKKIIDERIWNEYYKFCFERNPWDRVISLYYFLLQDRRFKGKPRPSISEFINSDIPQQLKKKGIETYMIDGNIVTDRVCLYENLEEELEIVCNQKLGIPETLILPKAKGNYRTDMRHYREILGNDDREKISRMFAKEISLFGYKY